MLRERWLLVLPPVIEFLVDIVLTLRGQPADYWKGTVACVLEANPIGFYLLSVHPGAFIAAAAAYAVLFTLAIFSLPERWAFLLSLGLVIAHASGTNSWLLAHGSLYEGTHNALAATVAAVCYHTFFLKAAESDRQRHQSESGTDNATA